jgi:DNA modification methylase
MRGVLRMSTFDPEEFDFDNSADGTVAGIPVEGVEKRWIDPSKLVESRHYHGDTKKVKSKFTDSIEDEGVLSPVLVRVEDGDLAYIEGGKQVQVAEDQGQQVPIYVCDDNWNDDKVLKTQLFENTEALSSKLPLLRTAWLVEDMWSEMDHDYSKFSPSTVAEELDVSERTARRYIEAARSCWRGTTIDRDLFENGQIRRDAANDKYIIGGLTIEEVDEVSYSRLEDIRKITNPGPGFAPTQEIKRFDDLEMRKELLARHIRYKRSSTGEGISGDEIRRMKQKIAEEEMIPPRAMKEVLESEPEETQPTFKGDSAELIEATADHVGASPESVVEQAVEQYVDSEGISESLEPDVDPTETEDDYVDQLDLLDSVVQGSRYKPDLRIEDNGNLTELDPNVALTVTSPPYNLRIEMEGVDDDQDYYDYLAEHIAGTFTDVYQVTLPGGFLCINVPIVVNSRNTKTPKNCHLSFDVERLLTGDWMPRDDPAFRRLNEQTEWELHHPVIWEKGYGDNTNSPQSDWPAPPQEDLNTTCEALLVFRKPGERENITDEKHDQSKIYWDSDNITKRDLRDMKWSIPTSHWEPSNEDEEVPTFPEELVRRCIVLWSFVGDTVLDPYCGRGTVLKMGERYYRRAIGYELREELKPDIEEYVGL